jgi:hypothetical protein
MSANRENGEELRSGIRMGKDEKNIKWRTRWEDSKGMLLILASESFGSGMAAAARLLEMGDGGMTTLQVCVLTTFT